MCLYILKIKQEFINGLTANLEELCKKFNEGSLCHRMLQRKKNQLYSNYFHLFSCPALVFTVGLGS